MGVHQLHPGRREGRRSDLRTLQDPQDPHSHPHLHLKQIPDPVKLDSGASDPHSDTRTYEHESFCIYPLSDNLDNPSDTNHAMTTRDVLDSSCFRTNSDNHNTSSGATSEHVNQSIPIVHNYLDKSDTVSVTNVKPKTSLPRNPPKLEQSTWDNYDSEYSAICQKSWDGLRKGLITPEQFVTDLNSLLGLGADAVKIIWGRPC